MLEYLFMKDKVISFKESGYCEIYEIEQVELFEAILKKEKLKYIIKYSNSPLGEYWYFENNNNKRRKQYVLCNNI